MINYGRRRAKAGWNERREEEMITIRLPSLLDPALLCYLLVFTMGRGINISSQIGRGKAELSYFIHQS